MTDEYDWAKRLVDTHAYVIHLPTRTVGQIKDVYGPSGDRYVSPINNLPVNDPVLAFEDGHTFVAVKGDFLRIGESDAKFFLATHDAVNRCAEATFEVAKRLGVLDGMARILVAIALRLVASTIERTKKSEAA
jgi:hypothetical protein